MNEELIRLEALKLASKTIEPNDDYRSLFSRAEEIYRYIKTGQMSELNNAE